MLREYHAEFRNARHKMWQEFDCAAIQNSEVPRTNSPHH